MMYIIMTEDAELIKATHSLEKAVEYLQNEYEHGVDTKDYGDYYVASTGEIIEKVEVYG